MSVVVRCRTCEYWVINRGDEESGCCHFYPPTIKIENDGIRKKPVSMWPITRIGDWCGQWKSKAKELNG